MKPAAASFCRRSLLVFALFTAAGVSLRAETWRLGSAELAVEFDDRTASLAVEQKPSGRKWRQLAAHDAYTVASVERDAEGLAIKLQGATPLELRVRLRPGATLELEVSAAPGAELQTLSFPGPFAPPAADGNLVLPLSEGVLMPLAEAATVLGSGRTYAIYGMSGLIMPWAGVTDAALEAGCTLTIDTPFDASLRLRGVDGAVTPEVVWKGERGRFGYARKLRYDFFERGGYVAQAKRYREHVRRTREFSTLRERAASRPHVDQLVGAVHVYTWDDGRTAELAAELKQAGIERAWIGWDPSHPPYPEKGYDEHLEALGYLAGVYDLYRDCYDDREWDKKAATNEMLRGMWLHRYPYPGRFEQIVARRPDQSPMQIRFSGDVGLMRYWTCTKAMVPHVPERIGRELKTYPHNSIFLDVTLAADLFECAAHEHPMTRREDAAARLAIHAYMADKLGLVVGSEWGADYGVGRTEFLHGLMTLSQFWGEGAMRDEKQPYYLGNWRNTVRPTIMLGEARASETYWKYGLGPGYRVPLFQLVFHDCTVSSWRWDDNSHKQPDAWARKDLFNALYATAPQWNLDRANWDKHRARFVSSYRALAPVLRAVGYDEMTGHRFLTPDRSLQETTFSSGRRVIANFGPAPQRAGDLEVPAGQFTLVEPADRRR